MIWALGIVPATWQRDVPGVGFRPVQSASVAGAGEAGACPARSASVTATSRDDRDDEQQGVGAQLLDHLLRGDRPARDDLGHPVERVADVRGTAERLQRALADEHDRGDKRDGQQNVYDRADQVGPEVPYRRRPCREKPRIRATATAIPTAALTKFCTASDPICDRYDIVVSPE
jgi:hypothetical protein